MADKIKRGVRRIPSVFVLATLTVTRLAVHTNIATTTNALPVQVFKDLDRSKLPVIGYDFQIVTEKNNTPHNPEQGLDVEVALRNSLMWEMRNITDEVKHRGRRYDYEDRHEWKPGSALEYDFDQGDKHQLVLLILSAMSIVVNWHVLSMYALLVSAVLWIVWRSREGRETQVKEMKEIWLY